MRRLLAMSCAAAVVFALAGCQAFGEKSYRVPSPAMEPTLHVGAHFNADTDKKRPKIGDIIVFHPPREATDAIGSGAECANRQMPPCAAIGTEDHSVTFVKRVVAAGAQTVGLKAGHTVLDGRVQAEPFIRACPAEPSCNLKQAARVPSGTYYVLGDNHGDSADSRYWGPIRQEWIIGTVER